MSRNTATVTGFVAVLLWSLLALFTAASGEVPPFQLSMIAFAIGGGIGLLHLMTQPGGFLVLRQPLLVWLLGIAGLFGYHFAYFTALRNAPPVEAGLIAYLWPLLIVVFSALLPGEQLRWHHVIGAVLGLCGAILIVTKGGTISFQPEYAFGYIMALICALTWSGYSVLSRRVSDVPTGIVAGYCVAASLLSAIAHFMLEETVWPTGAMQWAATIGLGLGPVGLAFYVWDYGIKRGDVQVLGASSYMAPLLSTLVLVAAGFADFTWTVLFACLLITLGAVIASKDLLLVRSRPDRTEDGLN